MKANEPITRRKLSDAVRERLLEAILSGDFAPGDQLPSERDLMETYQVGRPAVREALQSLHASGLIDVRHGGRSRVTKATVGLAFDQIGLTMRHVLAHSAPTLEHLKDVRIATETHLARRAATARSDTDIARLETILVEQESAKGDSNAFADLDGAFHASIARSAGNPVFTALSEAVFSWMREFHVSAVHRPGLEDLTLDEHRQILDAITQANADAASDAMHRHLSRANALYASENLRT